MAQSEAPEALDTRLQKLEILESVLHQYQEPQFKIMGNILLEIQRHKMYSLRTCKNLREYVLKHHTFQWRSARRYMNAVRVMDFLADRHEVLPTSEKQVRCLALCTKDEVNSIWAKAVETAAGQSVQITANLVKSIKNQICKEVASKQSSRGPRPWQDEQSQPPTKRHCGRGGMEHNDSSWEFAESSTDEGDSDEEVQRRALRLEELKARWGRKRSRYHGYTRVECASTHPNSTNLPTSAEQPTGSLSAMLGASFQPLTPPLTAPVSGQTPSNPAMTYPSIPLPPAGPLAMSDIPPGSAVEGSSGSGTVVVTAGAQVSMPLSGTIELCNTLNPSSCIAGGPRVEVAALDLVNMKQGMVANLPGVTNSVTNNLPVHDFVAFGENGNRASTGGGC